MSDSDHSLMRTLLIFGSRKVVSITLSFCHGTGAVSSTHDFFIQTHGMEAALVRVATDLARQGPRLREMQQAIRLLDQLMNQTDQRAKDAEEKAIAAVTAIGMVKIPEQKKIKLNNRDAEKLWPETYTADRVDKKSFAEFLGDTRRTRVFWHQSYWRDRCWNGLPPSATKQS